MRAKVVTGLVLVAVAAAGTVIWVEYASPINHWLAIHTGTINESGPYYGFWSGFGSDIAEFGIIGAIGTGIYQQIRRYNCHQPGCFRIGNHSAAGGQFRLCYRHHPDYQGKRPSAEIIARLHREHAENENSLRQRNHQMAGLNQLSNRRFLAEQQCAAKPGEQAEAVGSCGTRA